MAAGSQLGLPARTHVSREVGLVSLQTLRLKAGSSWGTGAPFMGSGQPVLQASLHSLGQEGCRHPPQAWLGPPTTDRAAPQHLPHGIWSCL